MTTLDIQRRLKALGFDPGTPDGIAGAKTEAAIRAFQKSRGLVADGRAGPITVAALAAPEPISTGKAPGRVERLDGVHPDLVRVIMRAAGMAKPGEEFFVLEGVRSKEQMMVNYGKGRTASQCEAKGVPGRYAQPKAAKVTWLSNPFMSNHRRRADGYGRAADLAPEPLDWNDTGRFDRLAALMFRAASIEGVAIRWGADWDGDGKPRERGESDSPHFELA